MARTSGTRPKGNGPGMGPGWGGPERGASTSRLAPSGDAYSDAIRDLARDPAHAASKVPLRELALQTWVTVALASDNDSARVMAAEKIAKRVGLPEEPVVNINLNRDDIGNLTDDELREELARYRRAGTEASASGGAASPGEPDSGVPPV